jgi:hypothetical protein
MSSIANPGNYLRTSRNFPTEAQPLSVELSRAYVDIANQVNDRISGIFGTTLLITGESWFISGETNKQQTLREVFLFSDANLVITHGINLAGVVYFTRIYGTFFDGTNWWPLPYVDVASATNQINVSVNGTQITVTKGAGSPPAIVSGLIVLEWLSQV